MASMEVTDNPAIEPSISLTRIAVYGLLAIVLTSFVNGLIRILAVTVFDVPNVFALWWEPVLIASMAGAIGATLVYGVLTRLSSRPNRTFTLIAVIVLVLSFAGPVNAYLSPPPGLADAPWSVFATLVVMHVAAAAIIIGVLTRTTNQEVASR
ncbi:DUF6069 family protein [Natronosalvus halobius]|uniref:DUF6069 family protein n=1 Tax=Natronosalvus halobius TaxID=2953746 RepID=UPI00209EA2D5|nr:DUF6069 family protein [Natronosalvus halobius]USZ73489.1 DUF6069 family protein [Natronosalvus halobius]